MIKVENKFAAHGIFWFATLPVIGILIMPMFFNADSFVIKKDELMQLEKILSLDVNAATSSANAKFQSLFIDSGVYEKVNNFFAGNYSFGDLIPTGVKKAHKTSSAYAASLWAMLYRGIWRFTALWPSVCAILVGLGIPALIDGWISRAKKQYTFELHNPVYFWTASHSFIMVMGMGVFLPLTPIVLTPLAFSVYALTLCSTAWITAANFQTGR